MVNHHPSSKSSL